MKFSALTAPVFLAVFMVCAAAPAQFIGSTEVTRPGGNGNQTSTVVVRLPEGCPVSLAARQSGVTDMVKVKDGDKGQQEAVPGPRQRIRLEITHSSQVVGATVTARGLSARARVDRAGRDGSSSSDVRRTLDVKFSKGDGGTLWADLILPGFTAVNSIKLESISFADGSTRDVSGKGFCRVVPDPIMRVADR